MLTRRRWRLVRPAAPEVRELFSLTGSLDEIRDRFGVVKAEAYYEPREEIEPTDPVPIIVGRRRERKLLDARWGLFPYWARDAVHADLHGLADKPSIDRLIRRQRCVVPGSALVTLTEDGRSRRIVRMAPRDGGVFGMAGLYEEFTSPGGRLHRAFTILTVDRQGGPDHFRSRMPLLLGEKGAEQWLDPERKVDGAWNVLFHLPDEKHWIILTDRTYEQTPG